MRSAMEVEPYRNIPTPIDLVTAVKEFHALSSKDLSKLIRYAENGTIKWTKHDGSSIQIKVEILARNLPGHLMTHLLENKRDEQYFRYFLCGLRLLHSLGDLATRHSILEQVFFEDVNMRQQIFDLVFFMIIWLNNCEEEIRSSNGRILLHSALVACSLYLLTTFISSEWHELALTLLAYYKVKMFIFPTFTVVHMVIKYLQQPDTRMKLNIDEIHHQFQFCEASLQFLHSLCQQKLFREHLLKDEDVCEGGGVLQLVRDTLKLQRSEDPHLTAIIYRLKLKVLSIMLLLCEVESSSFLDRVSSTTQSLDLAKSTVFEVIEVVKMMFCGDLKDHPRGLLQLHAMRLTEIFTDDSNFQSHIASNLTEGITRVFTQPEREFRVCWCSSDREAAESDVFMEFECVSAVGQMLGLNLLSQFSQSTLITIRAPRTPYTHQKTSLLVKILANFTCFVPDVCKEEKGLFVTEFIRCLQKDGIAHKAAVAIRNLRSLHAHAESLIPGYLNEEDLHLLKLFRSQLEQQITSIEPNILHIKDVGNRGQCSTSSPEGVLVNLAANQLNKLNFNEFAEIQEAVSEEKQQKRRKRNKMNDLQIGLIESALISEPDMQRKPTSIQHWADKLSRHGSEVTSSQLKNWLNNRKAKLARAAATARTPSTVSDALTETQVGSGPDPVPDSPESPMDEYFDPFPSASHGTRQKDPPGPTSSFKRENGQFVMLTNDQGEEVGKGNIHLAAGIWFGTNLVELGLCVVDVSDLMVDKWVNLPYPSETTGSTFGQAEMILGRVRILWDSSKLLLINQ